jgi:hypothetical protein
MAQNIPQSYILGQTIFHQTETGCYDGTLRGCEGGKSEDLEFTILYSLE